MPFSKFLKDASEAASEMETKPCQTSETFGKIFQNNFGRDYFYQN